MPATVEVHFRSRNGATPLFSQFSTDSKLADGDTDPSAEPKASILAALLLRYEESRHRKFQIESRSLYDAVRRPRDWLCDFLHISKALDETKRREAVKQLLVATEAQPRDWEKACLEEKSATEPHSGGNGWVILTDRWAQAKVGLFYNGKPEVNPARLKAAAAYLLGKCETPWAADTSTSTPGTDESIGAARRQKEGLVKTNTLPQQLRTMEDGDQRFAQIAFVILRGLDVQTAEIAFEAIQRLHSILRKLFAADPVYITSALHGAVIGVPVADVDTPVFDLRERLPAVVVELRSGGLPFRIGLAHGPVFWLREPDERGTFIGVPVNIAARLAYADENPGVLCHETFEHGRAGEFVESGWLRFDGESVSVSGKKHDQPFQCRLPKEPISGGNDFLGVRSRDSIESDRRVNAVAIAFDLPQFSAGDALTVSHRFHDFVFELRRELLRKSVGHFYYSPGGDGAIIVVPGAHADAVAVDLARTVDTVLRQKERQHQVGAELRSRVGLRYGVILLYDNAEGVRRPTGRVCFIADKLALGQDPGVIVYSSELKDAAAQNSQREFDQVFAWLSPLDCPPDDPVGRFAKKGEPPSLPLNDQILHGLQKIIEENQGEFALTVVLIFGPEAPRNDKGHVDVTKLVATMSVDGMLLKVHDWLEGNRNAVVHRESLESFCGGLAYLAVNPLWVAELSRTGDGVAVEIPGREVLGKNDLNLAYLLVAAATWKPGRSFDLEGLFGEGERCRNELLISDEVIARDPTEEALIRQVKRSVIDLVLPPKTEAEIDAPGRLSFFYEKALEQMKFDMRAGQGFRVIYPKPGSGSAKVAHFARLGLDRRSVAYLLCRVFGKDEVVPNAIPLAGSLHMIRNHLKIRFRAP